MTEVEVELARDDALLQSVEHGAPPAFRTWRAARPVVVLGRAVDVAEEVDEAFCAAASIPIVRRSSGGRSVLVGPGTLQYAFALPYAVSDELATISGSKRFCNALLLAGLARACHVEDGTAAGTLAGRLGGAAVALRADESGDLVRGDRKVAGVALRRRRTAMLLHGTILMEADLSVIARALRHPIREPAYRLGRAHQDFLENLGRVDEAVLVAAVGASLARDSSNPQT
jgi:lipoate-protein ligase A